MYVCLETLCANFDGTFESPHGVLGELGLVASMGYSLWFSIPGLIFTGKCKRSYPASQYEEH